MNQLSLVPSAKRETVLSVIDLCCQVFWGPSIPLCQKLFTLEFIKDIESFNQIATSDPSSSIEALKAYIGGLRSCKDLYSDLETSYVSLFISNRKEQIVPLYESCYAYENAPMMGPPAKAMIERLDKAGLSIGTHSNEPPDHLCVEVEYLYYLCKKGWKGNNDSLLEEAASFAKQTMLPWVHDFQKRLSKRPEAAFYSIFTAILIAALSLVANAG